MVQHSAFPNLKAFRDFATFGERLRRPVDRKPKPTIESPLLKKRNKGKKISLETADRLFAGLKERLNRLPSYEEFGVDVALVLLFGSYLRREPEVGDIDLVVFSTPRQNYDVRKNELIEAGRSGNSIIDQLYGPEREVLQFLKNRSSWLALHELAEAALMENLAFKVVHYSSEFKPLVDKFERKELTAEKFLKAAEDFGTKLRAGMFAKIQT